MPGLVQLVDYGPDAFAALGDEITTLQGSDPLRLVTVLVPSARAAVSLRHRLARTSRPDGGRGIANVRLVTIAALVEELAGGAEASSGRSPATRAIIGAAVRAAARQEGGILGAIADEPATEVELVARYEELRSAALGRAVHAVLQQVDLVTGANLEALAGRAAVEEGCPERTGEGGARGSGAGHSCGRGGSSVGALLQGAPVRHRDRSGHRRGDRRPLLFRR